MEKFVLELMHGETEINCDWTSCNANAAIEEADLKLSETAGWITDQEQVFTDEGKAHEAYKKAVQLLSAPKWQPYTGVSMKGYLRLEKARLSVWEDEEPEYVDFESIGGM